MRGDLLLRRGEAKEKGQKLLPDSEWGWMPLITVIAASSSAQVKKAILREGGVFISLP